MKKTTLTILMLSSSLMLTACNDDDRDYYHGEDHSSDINDIKNPVVNAPVAYTLTDMSTSAADSVVMTYKMKGVNNTEVQATTLVFTPKTVAPKGGWPIVVWAHGTTGVADVCAPSRSALNPVIQSMITKLLNAGYVVVAPNYEGLGEPGEKEAHPFLNLKSEAYSITDAVVATRNYLDKQGKETARQWVTVGHSQGGQAALGAAQYASRAQLDYKGTVAIAPASNLSTIFDFGTQYAQTLPPPEQIELYASLNTYGALIVAGMQSQPNPATYTQVFQPQAAITAADASTVCATPLGGEFGAQMAQAYPTNMTLSGYLTQTNFMQVPMVATFINKTAQPLTVKVTTPITIYQGAADTTVPILATDRLVASARLNGTVIEDKNYKIGLWDHTSAYTSNIDNIVADVKEMISAQ